MTHGTPGDTKTTYPYSLVVISVVGGIWRQLKEEEEELEEEERMRRRGGHFVQSEMKYSQVKYSTVYIQYTVYIFWNKFASKQYCYNILYLKS